MSDDPAGQEPIRERIRIIEGPDSVAIAFGNIKSTAPHGAAESRPDREGGLPSPTPVSKMPFIDFIKVEAALNAYPWPAAAFERDACPEPVYDAVGLLLRYAGVPQAEIQALTMGSLWRRYGALLTQEYGIPDESVFYIILCANDSGYDTQADAVAAVLNALRGDLSAISPAWYAFLHNLLSARPSPGYSLAGLYDPAQ
jgi:hypothetical protein